MQRAAGRTVWLSVALSVGLLAGCAEEKPTEGPEAGNQAIAFADPNLEAVVREAIGKPTGDILRSDVASLTSLDASCTRFAPGSIHSLDGLQHLAALTELDLVYNEISDLSPLVALSALRWLYLSDNQISDLSPLSGLTALTGLGLGYNQISDLSALVQNPGLGEGDTVHVFNNPLTEDAINVQIPALRARGVTVYY